MASTYSTSLRLELPGDGEQSGAWGVTTNRNLGTLIEEAIAGVASVTHDDSASYSLTELSGVTDESRKMIQEIGGTLTAARNVVVPDATKLYVVKNATSGGFSITVKTSAGTGVTIPNGDYAIVYSDGTNVVSAIATPVNGALAALDTVSATEIDSNAITNAKMADDSVDTAEIVDGAVTAAKLASDSVTTVKILDDNVTTAKIAAAAITATEIASDAVTTAKILDANVTYAKMASAAIASAANVRASASSVLVTPSSIESSAAAVALSNASATVAVDWDSGINFTLALNATTTTLGFPSNVQPGTWRRLEVTQDTTTRTLAFTATGYHSADTTAPVVSSASGAVDVFYLYGRTTSIVEVYTGGQAMGQIA